MAPSSTGQEERRRSYRHPRRSPSYKGSKDRTRRDIAWIVYPDHDPRTGDQEGERQREPDSAGERHQDKSRGGESVERVVGGQRPAIATTGGQEERGIDVTRAGPGQQWLEQVVTEGIAQPDNREQRKGDRRRLP